MRKKRSEARFVALATDVSTAVAPIFIKESGGRTMETTHTPSLWEAKIWEEKKRCSDDTQFLKGSYLPHRVRITLTID